MQIADRVLAGERLALARLLTQIENGQPEGLAALDVLFAQTGKAQRIGVTGAPGTGKSSLVSALARAYRQPIDGRQPLKVAIVAVDPSSPFTGGAILGDRIRMRDLSGDPGVFIRSMASRGALGGLARATAGVTAALDAAGYNVILIETVGAGQAEVEIAALAHTTIVVEAPGLGDDVQAIKAGILEIADVLVINKADRPGVEATERALNNMLQLAHPQRGVLRHHGEWMQASTGQPSTRESNWIPPLLKTVAPEHAGISELVAAIARHRSFLESSGEWQQRESQRLEAEMKDMLTEHLMQRWWDGLPDGQYQAVIKALTSRQITPQQALDTLTQGDQS